MNKVRLVVFGAVAAMALLACEQPFKAGLGPVVDIRPPTITLDSPGAGDYIWGSQTFSGTAEDDYILSTVEFMVTNYPDIDYYREWTEANLVKRTNKGDWTVVLDTLQFPDGDIKIRLKVTDSVNKFAETDEIAFYIKNQPPAISLAAPFIARGKMVGSIEENEADFLDNIGRVGGAHLNYYFNVTTKAPLNPATMPGTGYKRAVDKNTFISGSISDDEGIYIGPKTEDRFPPQIRIWQVGGEKGSLPQFDPGTYPSETELAWEDFKLNENLFTMGSGNFQFAYDVPPDSGRYYGFEIRAQQVNPELKTIVHYPQDYYTGIDDWNDNPADTPELRRFKQENRYVLIYVSTPQSVPTVDMYTLEDLNPARFSDGIYQPMPVDTTIAYPWVDQAAVNKNGPFTLRLKASHAEGISSAEVYWEKDDKTKRGRFIWDPTEKGPAGVDGKPVADWPEANNVDVSTTPYSFWGYRDPRSFEGGFYKTRHFIFTYNNDGTDKIGATGYHAGVQGRSKIQQYKGTDVTGTDSAWARGKREGLWGTAAVFDGAVWDEVTTLDEGLYYIEVYARSLSGTPITTPFTCEIRLDWGKPVVDIIEIDGAYGKDLDGTYTTDTTATVVNGVIRPRMSISDADTVNAGLRTGTLPYFEQGTGVFGMEQFYVLIDDADKAAMDTLVANGLTNAVGKKVDWWPADFTNLYVPGAIIPGKAVRKHGSVFQSQFLFKTSNTHSGYDGTDATLEGAIGNPDRALPDGVYWLYVFARDNAYNVGRLEPQKLRVVFASDKPRFDFSVGVFTDAVKNPYTNVIDTNGFLATADSGLPYVRNTMGPSQDIQVRIYDDDSLDLGYGPGNTGTPDANNSKVSIKFTGFTYDIPGSGTPPEVVKALADVIELTDIQVKRIFPVQTGNMKLDKTRNGTIQQSVLVSLLKAKAKAPGSNNYRKLFSDDGTDATDAVIDAAPNRLPDGMYKIDIGIRDYNGDAPPNTGRPRAKLTIAGDTDPTYAEADTSFWFVVDRADPAVTGVTPATNQYVSESQMSGGITGTVTDRNGPITATAEIRNATGGTTFTGTPPTFANDPPITLNPSATADVTWKSGFNVPINLNNYSGTFTVILEFKDRFGNTTRLEQRYSVDTQPPKIDLKTRMITVDRSLGSSNPDFTQALLDTNGLGAPLTNTELEVLANGFVSFTLSATDDFAVRQAKWWLVDTQQTITATVSGSGESATIATGAVTGAVAPVVQGTLSSGFTTTPAYIDTTTYSDGTTLYLYGAALDTAGLLSAGNSTGGTTLTTGTAHLLQKIYVYQPSDKPFFGPIRPNENSSVGKPASDKAIRGVIYDDDGFFEVNNNTVRQETVRVWMSIDTAAGTLAADTADASNIEDPTGKLGYIGPVILPQAQSGTVNRSGRNINLNIPLETLANGVFKPIWDAGDGTKHYVLEVTDSNYGKFIDPDDTTGAVNTEQTTRRYFSFEYDQDPPEFDLIYPTATQLAAQPIPFNSGNYDNPIDSGTANGFGIKFTISDANLALLNGNEAYLEYRFNNETARRQYPLGSANTVFDTGTGKWFVTDRVLSSNVAAPNNFATNVGFAALPDGRNTIYLYVKDKSGQESQKSFTFNKDLQPPNVYLNENAVKLKDINATTTTWWPVPTAFTDTGAQAWYTQRRALLADKKVPVVMYDSSKIDNFTLSGSFEDTVSDINPATFYIRFDSFSDAPGDWIPIPAAQISGSGRNVSWTVYLTTGTDGGTASGTPLPEGLHSISLKIADELGNEIPYDTDVNYAFRVIKTVPTVTITNASVEVYGDKPGSGNADTILSVKGTAVSSNLSAVKLVLRHVDSMKLAGYTPHTRDLIPPTGSDTNVWTFAAGSETGSVMENLAWEAVVTKGNLLSFGELQEGLYEVSVIARDLYGVDSVEALWEFTVDKTKPDFGDFTGYSPSTASATLTPYSDTITAVVNNAATNSNIVIRSTEPRLQARIGGTGSNVTQIDRQIRKYNYAANSGGGAWEYWNGTAWTTAEAWIIGGLTTGLPETRMDWLLKDTFNDGATPPVFNLPDGFYSYRIRAKDASKIDAGTDTGWLNTDNGNPAESEFVYFFYATGAPTLSHDNPERNSFSSRVVSNNEITLTGESASANQFSKMVVSVAGVNVTVPAAATLPGKTVYGDGTNSSAKQTSGTWNWSVTLAFKPTLAANGNTNADGLPDGSYRVNFAITDMAGRVTQGSRVITLDNTPPKTTFVAPREIATGEYPKPFTFGVGETFIGGENAAISGTTEDNGINGSASGVAAVWYHLGYVANAVSNTPAAGPAFPTQEALIGAVSGLGTEDLGGADHNALFDAAAANVNTAWFKYVPTDATHPVPEGFKSLTATTADVLNWVLETNAGSSIANLAGSTRIKTGGRLYNDTAVTTARPWLVKQIANTGLPSGVGKDGLYSMPLWVRVADTAGNVSYTCYDIWIYPNGDYPSVSISNPSAVQTLQGAPRGGMVNIDGIASDNVSVKKVIYRIKVDNANTNANNTRIGSAPPDYEGTSTNIVRVDGATALPGTATEFNLPINPAGTGVARNPFKPLYEADNVTVKEPALYSTDGWYYANLESAAEPDIPWNFIVNANDEVKNLIATKGFRNAAGTGANDMIRVWVEIFVFDEPTAGATGYNKISLGGPDAATPKPTTREFYLKSSSPQIPYKWISGENTTFGATPPNVNGLTAPNANYAAYSPGDNVRSKRFAIGARLDGNGTNIGQIAVRLSGETAGLGGAWRTVWQTGDGNNAVRPDVGGGIQLNRISATQYDFTYAFDSTATTANYATVRNGDWAVYGGRFTVEVRVRDTSSPAGEASYVFEVGVDNYAPLADEGPSFTTPKKVAGSNVIFQGRVFDYHGLTSQPNPPFRSVEKVYAWFTKTVNGTSRYVNANTGAVSGENGVGTPALSAAMTVYRNRTATVTYSGNDVTRIDYVNGSTSGGTAQHPTADGWVKEISETTAAVMANRMTWQPSQKWDIRWDFTADTTILPDGWLEMNYIVVDSAGNASFYQQTMVVMNHNPVITDVVLYTNNRGTGAVFTTHDGDEAYSAYEVEKEPKTKGYLESGFISKNRVIGFGISTANGARNWPLHYSVQHVTRVEIPLSTTNLTAMANKAYNATIGNTGVYTIKDAGQLSESGWRSLGMKDVTLQTGNHFVFQATAAEIAAQSMNLPGVTVYGYQTVGSLPTLRKDLAAVPPAANTINVGGRNILLDVQPDATFSFNNDGANTHFALEGNLSDTARIKETTIGDSLFLIRVWDTVDNNQNRPVTGFNEDNMLYDIVVVGMNVYLSDTEPPTARLYDLNPYTEINVVGYNVGADNQTATIRNAADPTDVGYNILRGGLYNAGTERAVIKSGYIEPRNNTGALRPFVDGVRTNANGFETGDIDTNIFADGKDRVSGKVILRGVAHDNQLLDQISIDIAGASANPGVILRRDTTTGSATYGQLIPNTTTTQAYAYESLNWQTGHTVEWAYVWDTEKFNATGTPAADVQITVQSRDFNSRNGTAVPGTNPLGQLTSGVSALTANSTPTATSTHNRVNVDIVAYVTGLEREKPKFATTRSRQGWYSFYQDEPNIAVMGYNLGTNTANVLINLDETGGGGIDSAPAGYGAANATVENIRNRFYFTMPATAKSSKIDVKVNNVSVHNHSSNHADKSWNREYNAYTSGSDLWVNKPYAHVWRTSESGTAPATYFGNGTPAGGSMGSSSPAMALQYVAASGTTPTTGQGVGVLHGAWSIYGQEGFYYGMNTGNARTNLQQGVIEPYSDTDIDYYNGNPDSRDFRQNLTVLAANQADGNATLGVNTNLAENYTTIITGNTGRPTDRWQNGRVILTYQNANTQNGTSGGLYAVTYDSYYKSMTYVRRQGGNNGTVIRIDGGEATGGVVNNNDYGTVGAGTGNNTTSTSSRAGRWSAVGFTDDGQYAYPVVAYYDETNDTLRLAYSNAIGSNTGTNPGATNWTRRNVFNTTDPLFRGSGMYVSMKVGSDMRIHLAFYNNVRNTVVYAVGTTTGAFTAYTVDNVVAGGTWTDIALDNNGRPWIVYGNSARTGNYDGARIAYQTRASNGGANEAGAFNRPLTDTVTNRSIQGWEAVSMPADYRINDDRLNIEAWPPNNRSGGGAPNATGPGWNAAVGYGSDMFRIGYFFKPDNGIMANW